MGQCPDRIRLPKVFFRLNILFVMLLGEELDFQNYKHYFENFT